MRGMASHAIRLKRSIQTGTGPHSDRPGSRAWAGVLGFMAPLYACGVFVWVVSVNGPNVPYPGHHRLLMKPSDE